MQNKLIEKHVKINNELNQNEQAIKDEFIKQKLYIPIKDLIQYLQDNFALSFTIVFENGKTEDLYDDVGIDYLNTFKVKADGTLTPSFVIISGSDEIEKAFEYDIDKYKIVGFFNLTMLGGNKIKETFMDYIIEKEKNK